MSDSKKLCQPSSAPSKWETVECREVCGFLVQKNSWFLRRHPFHLCHSYDEL